VNFSTTKITNKTSRRRSMNNFVHDGNTVVVPAPREVFSGDGVQVGALFGIAATWAPMGQQVALSLRGVFEIKKVANEYWPVGARVYWDDTQHIFCADPANAAFVGVAVGETKMEAPGVGRIRLNGTGLVQSAESAAPLLNPVTIDWDGARKDI
jgi:predicted RecA/RadA family phage recombinase